MELKKQLVRATSTPAFSFICGGWPWVASVLIVIFRHEPSLNWYMAGVIALLFTYPGAILNLLWSRKQGSEPILQVTIVIVVMVIFVVPSLAETSEARKSYTELESFVILASYNCAVVLLRIVWTIAWTVEGWLTRR